MLNDDFSLTFELKRYDEYILKIREILGEKFVRDELEIESECLGENSDAHPFREYWIDFLNSKKKSEEKGCIYLTEKTFFVYRLLRSLLLVIEDENFEVILNKLKNKNTFFSSMFELNIFTEYFSIKREIKILKESCEESVKTPDLFLNIGSGIFVECKSLFDKNTKVERLKKHIIKFTEIGLRRYKKGYKVSYQLNKMLIHDEVNQLRKTFSNDIESGYVGKREIKEIYVVINYEKLCDWDIPYRTPYILDDASLKSNIIKTEILRSENGNVVGKNLIIINVEIKFEENILSRILSNFKKARKQIPADKNGIIFIEIKKKNEIEIIKIFKECFDEIFNRLNNDSDRVNCLVLVSYNCYRSYKSYGNGNFYVIPNLTTRNNLPEDFVIPHCGQLDSKIDFEKASLKFSFNLKVKNNEDTFVQLVNHASSDGRIQLKIFVIENRKFLIILFTPIIKLICLETEIINITQGEHEVEVSYSTNGLIFNYDSRDLLLRRINI